MPVREEQDPDTVGLVRRRLQQDRPDSVDETLALAGEVLLVTGWKLTHAIRIDPCGPDGEGSPLRSSPARAQHVMANITRSFDAKVVGLVTPPANNILCACEILRKAAS